MRLKSLDSLRGIAALIVVLFHCSLALPGGIENRAQLYAHGFAAPNAWLYLTPLRLLVAGPAAVLIFFVLSGLVLALTFVERDRDRYASFVVKRLTRIWPTFVVVILVSALLKLLLPSSPVEGASPWVQVTWGDPLGTAMILHHLFLAGSPTSLDLPMWSLVHEVRISLIFPVLVWATAKNWIAMMAGSIVLLFVCTSFTHQLASHPLLFSFTMTMAYTFLFVAGIVLAFNLRPLRRRLAASHPGVHLLLWAIAFCGIVCAPGGTARLFGFSDAAKVLVSGGAAALIVLLSATEGKVLKGLLGPIPTYLGRISYSLYLVHVVVIAAVAHAANSLAPFPVLLILSVLISIGVADFCQRYVERPTTEWGRRLARWIDRSPSRPSRPASSC